MARIITFDELKDYYQFLRLMDAAFSWSVTPQRITRIRKLDVRFKHPWGFGMMQGRELIGFTGVADIPVRTLDGQTEMIGGIHIVATYPGMGRGGIATRLLEHAHSHFRKKGYRFAILCTSKSLVAHSLYERLGYADIESINRTPQAYKLIRVPRGPTDKSKKKPNLDWKNIEGTFEHVLQDWTGLAVRPPNWASTRVTAMDLKPENVIVVDGGYAITDTQHETLLIYEIIARNRQAYLKLLEQARRKGKRIISDCFVHDPVLLSIYRRQRYAFRYGSYFIAMCKPLTGISFKEAFGDRFYFSYMDRF